jgi:hypothetical protein
MLILFNCFTVQDENENFQSSTGSNPTSRTSLIFVGFLN